MVRIKPRRSFEEIYGEIATTTATATHNTQKGLGVGNLLKTKDFGKYAVPPINATGTHNAHKNAGTTKTINPTTVHETGRRKTTRPLHELKPVTVNLLNKEEKIPAPIDKYRKDNIKQKTNRLGTNVYNNREEFYPEGYLPEQKPKPLQNSQYANNQHFHHHQPKPQEQQAPDDDEDAEEFFDMIRQTVETAVGRTITDLLGRNLMEVHAKLDKFTAELKNTQNMVTKLHNEVNKQIAHYGEEGSRHFRYLCMKSEYDKMFYQHQTIVGNGNQQHPSGTHIPMPQMGQMPQMPQMATMPGTGPQFQGQFFPQMPGQQMHPNMPKVEVVGDGEMNVPCTCRPAVPVVTSSNGNGVNNKTNGAQARSPSNSSEAGIREVLGQIQRFCNQLQGSDTVLNKNNSKRQRTKRPFRADEATIINKDVFAVDDDDCLTSSDNISPRSFEQMTKYEAKAMRTSKS